MTDQLRRVDAAIRRSDPPHALNPRLVVPEGWVIDEAACDRLMRQLDRAPAHVAGVVAEVGGLPPGASYRVHAEWRSLEAPSAGIEESTTSVRGAVLTRPGVEFEVRGDIVDVGGAPLLVDPGATVHDPWGPVKPLEVASPYGRPPFPRRPVVVFGAEECDEDLADWARRLANSLVRRDVEARLALPMWAKGLHLTRPCLSGEESVRALAPDVVVALDSTTAAQASSWCDADRSTVMVELGDDISMTAQLVSWQIGRASGRLRARISRRVDGPSLAALARRLSAGPHPMPPSDRAEPATIQVAFHEPTRYRARRHGVPHARSMVVLTETSDLVASRRVEGLRDHLAAVGVTVEVAALDERVPASAPTTDLVMLAEVDEPGRASALVSARRGAGRATVVDVGPRDLDFAPTVVGAAPSLNPQVAELATRCGLATSSGGAMHAALHELGVRCHRLPTLLDRTRAAALREARAIGGFEARAELIIGWHVGSVRTPVPTYLEAVVRAISAVLADRAEARVELVGDPERVPAVLRGDDRVTISSGEVGPQRLTGWAVHLWSPPVLGGVVADDFTGLVDVRCAGVPSVLPAATRGAVDGHLAPELLVTDAERSDEWVTALQRLLDDEHLRVQRSRETFFQSRTVDGLVASKAVVNRFFGWARYERPA